MPTRSPRPAPRPAAGPWRVGKRSNSATFRARPSSTGRVAGVRPDRLGASESVARQGKIWPLTGRAAVLAVVVLALLFMLAYPLRAYLEQRHTIGQLEQRAAASQQRQQRLSQEIDRFNDPAHVAQKAINLGYVQPGQRRFVVQTPEGPPAAEASDAELKDQNAALLGRSPTEQAWYDQVVQSLLGPADLVPSPTASR